MIHNIEIKFTLCTNTEVSKLLDIKYLMREGEGVWSQSEVVNWEMSRDELSHQ